MALRPARQDTGIAARTPTAEQLHRTVDLLVTALSFNDKGERNRGPDETSDAIDEARQALATYTDAVNVEHTPEADVLAEALEAFLDWPTKPPKEQRNFTVLLHALEMARYQYGGESAFLGD